MREDPDPTAPHDHLPDRRDAGTFAPHVPYLSPRHSADHGPAGSLVQLRAQERDLRVALRPPSARDWRVWGAAGLAVTALALLAGAGPEQVPRPVILLLAVAVLAGAAAVLRSRYRPGDVEGDLSRQIARERRAARELDALRGQGWTVLHDRLVPGTEHRVAHLLAGPAGLVVAAVVPAAGPLRLQHDALLTGDVVLSEWFAARWWEVEQVNTAVSQQLSHWPWAGPTYPLALLPDDEPSGSTWHRLARRRTPPANPAPLAYARVAIRPVGRVRQWAGAMPAPLGRLAAAQLGAVLEQLCPPAATREQ